MRRLEVCLPALDEQAAIVAKQARLALVPRQREMASAKRARVAALTAVSGSLFQVAPQGKRRHM
jgi:hypothetical protein